MSDSGQTIVGETSPGVAFSWHTGESTIIDEYESWAYEINSDGWIVGTRTNDQDYYRGVVWRESGAVEIGTLDNVVPGNPGRHSWGEDINNSGVVAGTSHNLIGTSEGHAVRWTEAGGLEDLGTLPSGGGFFYGISAGYGINESNVVVGTSAGSDSSGTINHATLWDASGTPTRIGIIGTDRLSYGEEINDLGQVCGSSSPVDGSSWRAFLWESGTATELGTLGLTYTIAADINNLGQIVGWSYVNSTVRHAFIWEDSVMTDLNDVIDPASGWLLEGAYGINDDSQIVGWGTRNGQQYGFFMCLQCCELGGMASITALTDSTDSDGDAIFDKWEKCGIDINDDGHVDLYLKDADPDHRDLYVEIDAMTGLSPLPAALERVIKAFDGTPEIFPPNPDGKPGVKLHIVGDGKCEPCVDDIIPLAQWTGDPVPSFHATKATWFGTNTERTDPDSATILEAKKQVYRYCIFADTLGSRRAFGLGEGGRPPGTTGDDFMIALKRWPHSTSIQAGVFMHELGHTLGLHHGGLDSLNYKPNHHSVMNWMWATRGAWMTPGSWPLDGDRFGYSVAVYPLLYEAKLYEPDGIGDPGDFIGNVLFGTGMTDSLGKVILARADLGGGAYADWNINSMPDTDTLAVDINRSGVPGQYLFSYNEWQNIYFDFRGSPDFEGQLFSTSVDREMTYEEWLDNFYGPGGQVAVPEPDFGQEVLPAVFLSQNFPNPFRTNTQIGFSVPTAGRVTVDVINVIGQQVSRLFDEEVQPGSFVVNWDGSSTLGVQVSPGLYFYRLRTKDKVRTRKLVLLPGGGN